MSEFTYPDNMKNGQLGRLLNAIEMEATCPACENQEGYHSSNPDPTEWDMKAWLADGDIADC